MESGTEMMVPAIDQLFLGFSSSKLHQLSSRVESCLAQLDEAQVWARDGEHENSVGNLVLHLCGNLREWIIASIAGQPNIRQRDQEFSARGGVTIRELTKRLRATVTQATAVIGNVSKQQLSDRLMIKGRDVSVLDAIYHVVEHFAMHAGQIFFVTKKLTGGPLHFQDDLQSVARSGQQVP